MNGKLRRLIERLKKDPAWTVFPPGDIPEPSNDPRAPHVSFPDAVLYFYRLCGGMETNIRSDDDLDVRIVPAAGFSWAIKEIIGSLKDSAVDDYRDNILWHCYVFASVGTDEYFVIDLAPERYGSCYYTEFYFLGREGWTPIIANSFPGLLQRLEKAATMQEERFWESDNLGDAYDQ